MTLTYRTSGVWGAGSGSPLTKSQFDNNTYELHSRLAAIEALSIESNNIVDVERVGNTLVFHFEDGSTDVVDVPPFEIPFRGPWVPDHTFFAGDLVNANGALYEVQVDHVTDPYAFDPGATNGAGDDLYMLVLENPAGSLPTGGPADWVLAKASGSDFDTTWMPTGVPREGVPGALLVKVSYDDFDTEWLTPEELDLGGGGGGDLPVASDVSLGAIFGLSTPDPIKFVTGFDVSGVPTVARMTPEKMYYGTTNIELSPSGTVTVDSSLYSIWSVTPTGNMTINANSVPFGKDIYVVVSTFGFTSYTITFNLNFLSAGTLATGTAALKKYILHFVSYGGVFIEVSRIGPL